MKPYEELYIYTPRNLQEGADRKVMMRYIEEFPNVYTRGGVHGHIISSLWIVNVGASKVLMICRNICNFWDWYGGHADGDRDLVHVTLKEGREETGLKKLELLSESTLAIDMLPVPPHVKRSVFVSFHVHLNAIYLYQADERSTLRSKPDENSGAR